MNVLEVQLKAEIDRSKQLAARPNNKDIVGKGRVPNRADTRLEGLKQSNAYRLYEDMTNILFLDCRCELAGDADDEQWVYNCVYSADGKTSLCSISIHIMLAYLYHPSARSFLQSSDVQRARRRWCQRPEGGLFPRYNERQ